MKCIKPFAVLFLFLLITSSCSEDDNNNNPADNAQFTATLDGGSFNNYSATLGFYNAELGITNNTLNINVTDANNNVINMFMNSTGGLGSGVIKQIGDVDSENFSTTVVIRDQEAQITYSSISGSITITENRVNPSDDEYNIISGTFNITASINTGAEVIMTGSFSDLQYFN
nr:hypothetical protein [uncultured Psychroserpens sp.]